MHTPQKQDIFCANCTILKGHFWTVKGKMFVDEGHSK